MKWVLVLLLAYVFLSCKYMILLEKGTRTDWKYVDKYRLVTVGGILRTVAVVSNVSTGETKRIRVTEEGYKYTKVGEFIFEYGKKD